MNFFQRLVVLFYVTLGLFVGCFLVMYAFDVLDIQYIVSFIYGIQLDEQLKLTVGALGGVFLLINFLFFRSYSTSRRKENVIMFDNPDGRVIVALSALEDLVKRVTSRLSEIKEVKSTVVVSRKKGLRIKMRLTVTSEVSIPSVTSNVQDLIKKKIQDAIGLDELINIEIYVGKIIPEQGREQADQKSSIVEESSESSIPFQGYRA